MKCKDNDFIQKMIHEEFRQNVLFIKGIREYETILKGALIIKS